MSETALGAAEMRAEESVRADRLFNDPYAQAFVAAAPPLFADLPSIDDDPALAALKDAFLAEIAIRTRFYDDYLATACAEGCRQVVLLAAGLDTRAFRLGFVSSQASAATRTLDGADLPAAMPTSSGGEPAMAFKPSRDV